MLRRAEDAGDVYTRAARTLQQFSSGVDTAYWSGPLRLIRELLGLAKDQAQQIATAMKVLDVSMPESGLADACKQVKQVAISEADNSDKLEAQVATLTQELNNERVEVVGAIARKEAAMRSESAQRERAEAAEASKEDAVNRAIEQVNTIRNAELQMHLKAHDAAEAQVARLTEDWDVQIESAKASAECGLWWSKRALAAIAQAEAAEAALTEARADIAKLERRPTRAELEAAEAERDGAQNQCASAELELNEAGKEILTLRAKLELEREKHDEEAYEQMKEAVETLRAALEKAKERS